MRGEERWRFGKIFGVACLGLMWANPGQAHIDVISHQSRHGRQDQKVGPCGAANSQRGETVYEYAPGATITVAVDEYIAHPGWFRIAFDDAGQDDLLPPTSLEPPEYYVNDAVLLDNLDYHTSGGGTRRWQVTLPDVECDACTLQVIQVMLDKPPYEPELASGNDLYFACIDLVLSSEVDPLSPVETTGGTQGTGGTATAGAGGFDVGAGSVAGSGGTVVAGGSAGSFSDASAQNERAEVKGCSVVDNSGFGAVQGGGAPGLWGLSLLGVWWAVCVRRRRSA